VGVGAKAADKKSWEETLKEADPVLVVCDGGGVTPGDATNGVKARTERREGGVGGFQG